MNRFEEDNPSTAAERQLDLLVDGELNETDRRELLVRLDHEPDGWRRCALAFLESQCWRQELGPIARDRTPSESAEVASRPAEAAPRRQSWRHHLATLLTMAASFLIALVVGIGLRGNWSGIAVHSPGVQLKPAIDEQPLSGPGAVQVAASAGPSGRTLADDPQRGQTWEMVPLVAAKMADGQSDAICQVPAVHRDALDPGMLEQFPDAIPPQVRQILEEAGHRVVQERKVYRIQRNDGSSLVFPVESVEIRPVSRGQL
jgi:hypothetical protein